MLGSASFVRRFGLGALVAATALLARQPEARACGGCFHGPPPPDQTVDTVITAHRMAFSISTVQTVLWDQIQYSGTPSAFAWVLPVKPGAVIQLSHDEWMASLEAATQTVIQGPSVTCGGPPQDQDVGGSGGGCGASSSAASGFEGAASANVDAGAEGNTVTVVSQQVVGPYDAVTVRSSQGEALGAWLTANGYNVPASLQPLIDTFTTEGFDFIALKLAPGQGVQAMQPVRVVTQGADLSLPLRMVAAGVGAHVDLELFVLGEGEYQTQNFPQANIDFSKLAWDPVNDVSNYTTLAAAALAANGGTGWLTEMAGPVPMAATAGFSSNPGNNPPLDTTYETSCVPQMYIPPTCGDDAGAPDSGDAGSVLGGDAGSCAPVVIACDDLAVATAGIDYSSFTVTRLRASLPATALGNDLVLEASASQVPVPSFHATQLYTVPNYNPCASAGNGATQSSGSGQSSSACATTPKPGTRYADAIVLLLASVGIAFGARRRRRA
jgi:hypothetical protein